MWAHGGSALAASVAVHPEGIDSDIVVARANAARALAVEEPWRTILPAAAQLDLIARAGWSVVDSLDDATFGTGAARDRPRLVVAHPDPSCFA